MDASFDNTGGAQTNRFHVNANSQDVPFSKDGLLFELDGFKKQNGSEPEDPFFAEDRPTNGKRSSDHFEEEEDMDDEDDEDLGPETDVDAADEVLMSPSLAAARALLQAGVEGEGADQEPRQETPTPRAEAEGEAVCDAALVDNVGESGGEDSEDEDEWNYFKGDKKDDSNPQQPAADTELLQQNLLCDLEDAMNSPLNPEAPPFVPVSPTRPEPSALPAHLLIEEVVSQSPQKPVPMDDISVPEPGEFESEVSTRLHDLGNAEEYLNGHSDINAFLMSSQENLKETLHGNEKNQGGLDFGDNENVDHVNSTNEVVNQAEFDRVQKDTTDFCDIQVAFTPHTNQAFEDEGIDEELYERLKNKERDPMSMSFYQEKDEDTSEVQHNPFDLNAVQTLPNDSDEDFSNDQPLPDNSVQAMMCGINPFVDKQEDQSDVIHHEIHAAIADLDDAFTKELESIDSNFHKAASPLVSEKADTELAEDVHEPTSEISQLSESSEREEEHKDLLCPEEVETAVSQDSAFSAEVSSPIEAEGDLCHISKHSALSPEPFEASEEYLAKSPELSALSPEPVTLSSEHIALSPEPLAFSPEPVALSPEPVALSPEPVALSPEPVVLSPECDVQSPEPAALSSEPVAHSPGPVALSPEALALSPEAVILSPERVAHTPEPVAHSPEPVAFSPEPVVLSPELVAQSPIPISQSPEPRMESPEPRALSPELLAQSPEPEVSFCCEPQSQTPEPTEILSEHFEHSSEVLALAQEPVVAQSPIPPVLSPEPILSPTALSPVPQESQEMSEAYHLPVSHSPPERKEFQAYSPEPESQEFESQDHGFIQQFGQRENMFVCNVGYDATPPNVFEAVEKNDDILLNFQAPVEQVCEFIESSVVENVKNLDEFTTDEVCKPLVEAEEQAQQLLLVSENFIPSTDLTQDASFNDPNIVDYSFEAAEKEANQFIDNGSFVDEVEVEKSVCAKDESTINVTSEKSFTDVFSGPTDDDMINDIVSAPSDHFIREEVSHDLPNGLESGPIEHLTNGDVKSPLEEVSAPSEENVIAPLVISATVATAVAAAAAAVVTSEDKKTTPKAKSTSTVKKAPTATKTAVSPTKPTAPKATALSAAKKPLSLTAKPASVPIKSTLAPKLTAAKPKTATSATSPTAKPPVSKTLSAPRPKLPATAPKPAPVAEKKPLANGEVKREPIRRPVPGAAPVRATPAPKPAAPAAKPLAAPKAAAPRLTAARPASTPRPAPAAAAPAKPRPTPITRAPISKPSLGATRPTPAADKLAKETTNKQLSARPTPAPRTATSTTRTDIKTSSKPLTKTTTTTTVTKTNISPIKRPTSATTKTTLTKTTTTKTAVKTMGKTVSEKLNGSLEKSIKEIKEEMCLNGSPLITDLPLKDSSPQQVDNSLLPIIDAAAD